MPLLKIGCTDLHIKDDASTLARFVKITYLSNLARPCTALQYGRQPPDVVRRCTIDRGRGQERTVWPKEGNARRRRTERPRSSVRIRPVDD